MNEWDEEYVLALPLGENDSFERKGSRKLDLTLQGIKEGEVLDELAKQLSAFANTGGGHIIYGVTNGGEVDNGGVAPYLKGKQLTKDWLESVIPNLTEFEIVGFNVHPIFRMGDRSRIEPGKAIFVVEVPDSERAPHQSSRDKRYYVRLGGNSVPASHRLVEDIRTRRRYPSVELQPTKLRVGSLPPFESLDPQIWEGSFSLELHFKLTNSGRVMARNTCLQLKSNFEVVFMAFGETVRMRGESLREVFWEFRDPVYPGMEIGFNAGAYVFGGYGFVRQGAPYGGPWYMGKEQRKELSECRLDWELFADDAPPKQGNIALAKLEFEQNALSAIRSSPDAMKILRAFPRLRL